MRLTATVAPGERVTNGGRQLDQVTRVILGEVEVPSFMTVNGQTLQFRVPSATAPGSYYVFAHAERFGRLSSPTTLNVATAPDE